MSSRSGKMAQVPARRGLAIPQLSFSPSGNARSVLHWNRSPKVKERYFHDVEKAYEEWETSREDAFAFLLTSAVKATAVMDERLEAARALRAAAAAAWQVLCGAATRLQTAWRGKHARLVRRGRILVAGLRARARHATALQAVRRGSVARRVVLSAREHEWSRSMPDVLDAWRAGKATLARRADRWAQLFADVDVTAPPRRPIRVVTSRILDARAEAVYWRAEALSKDRLAKRTATLSSERKQLYAFLKSLDAKSLDHVAAAFGLAKTAKRRKRKVVASLFETVEGAPSSANVLRRFAHRHQSPSSYFIET